MVILGSGAEREVDNIFLTRYACYLVAQNGDSRKQEIAFAQNYFAIQTRRAELVEQRLIEYERVQARTKLAETEKLLSGVLYERGVDNQGFAIIRSKGDKALFHMDTKMLKRKLDVPDSRPLADFLPTISIKAKDFAAEMTSVNVQQKDLYGQTAIENEQNLIIEGAYIPFGWEKDFNEKALKDIVYCCLVMSQRYIMQNFSDIKEYADVIEQRMDDSWCTIDTVLAENLHYLELCEQHQYPYIFIDDAYDVDFHLV